MAKKDKSARKENSKSENLKVDSKATSSLQSEYQPKQKSDK